MTKRKKKKDPSLKLARELFRYEKGKLYWKSEFKFYPYSNSGIAGTSGRIIPRVKVNGQVYKLHRIVYLLHHGFCPKQLDFIDKTLTAEGCYDISIENLFEPPKKEVIRKTKKKYREELSYFEANTYLEYKKGRLYWKEETKGGHVVVGQLAGGPSGAPFLRVKLHNKVYSQHRVVYLLHHRFCPQVVTFIDKTLTDEGCYDISIENLKASTHSHEKSVAIFNKRAKTSKYRGVSLDREGKKYRVIFRANRIVKHGGLFENEEEAARKYDEMARQLIGEDAILNFP